MNPRRWQRVLLAATLALATTACGSGSDENDGSAQVLTVQVAGEREETAVYELLARAFEKQNEGVDIRLVEVAGRDDHLAKLVTAFAAGSPPDVFLVNYREYAQFVDRGALRPVSELLRQEGLELDTEAFYPQALEALTLEGEVQCLPQNVSSLVAYVNTDLFARAGLPLPSAGWSWDDLRRVARALTGGDVHGLGIDPQVIRVAPFVWSNGGEVVDNDAAPSRFTLDTPESREALEFLAALHKTDDVSPNRAEAAAADLETRFATGRLGIFLASRRATPVLREVFDLRWDVAPLPVADVPVGILHADGYCVSAPSKRHGLAAKFIDYVSGSGGQSIAALSGRVVPSRRSVAEGVFLDPTRPPASDQVFLDAIPTLRRTPVIATWPEIEDRADRVLEKLFYDAGYTVDDALRELEADTSELFSESRG